MSGIHLPVRYYRFYPGDSPIGHTSKVMDLETSELVLLLIDVYHAAEKPEAKDLINTRWDQAWWEIVDNRLAPVVSASRRTGLPVIYTTNSAPRIEMNRSAFGFRLGESLGFDPEVDFREPNVDPLEYSFGETVQLFIPPQIAPQPRDYYIRKHTYSGFYETRLDSLLRSLGARTIICAGFVADCCVFFTLADAVFRGFNTVLLRDCTLAAELPEEVTTFQQTQRILLWIESIIGPTATSSEFIQSLDYAQE
jgi:nicotinamidase-related amidase